MFWALLKQFIGDSMTLKLGHKEMTWDATVQLLFLLKFELRGSKCGGNQRPGLPCKFCAPLAG